MDIQQTDKNTNENKWFSQNKTTANVYFMSGSKGAPIIQ